MLDAAPIGKLTTSTAKPATSATVPAPGRPRPSSTAAPTRRNPRARPAAMSTRATPTAGRASSPNAHGRTAPTTTSRSAAIATATTERQHQPARGRGPGRRSPQRREPRRDQGGHRDQRPGARRGEGVADDVQPQVGAGDEQPEEELVHGQAVDGGSGGHHRAVGVAADPGGGRRIDVAAVALSGPAPRHEQGEDRGQQPAEEVERRHLRDARRADQQQRDEDRGVPDGGARLQDREGREPVLALETGEGEQGDQDDGRADQDQRRVDPGPARPVTGVRQREVEQRREDGHRSRLEQVGPQAPLQEAARGDPLVADHVGERRGHAGRAQLAGEDGAGDQDRQLAAPVHTEQPDREGPGEQQHQLRDAGGRDEDQHRPRGGEPPDAAPARGAHGPHGTRTISANASPWAGGRPRRCS